MNLYQLQVIIFWELNLKEEEKGEEAEEEKEA